MQAETPDSENEAQVDLSALSRRLVLEGMPIQRVIGEEAGVSQSTVSRAIHQRIGQSPGARKLWRYAEDRLAVLSAERGVNAENHEEGRTKAQRGRRRTRQPRLAHEQSSLVLPISGDLRSELERRAMDGLRNYLQDRFDPLLVIEQLAVLRRAQDAGRQARPDASGNGPLSDPKT